MISLFIVLFILELEYDELIIISSWERIRSTSWSFRARVQWVDQLKSVVRANPTPALRVLCCLWESAVISVSLSWNSVMCQKQKEFESKLVLKHRAPVPQAVVVVVPSVSHHSDYLLSLSALWATGWFQFETHYLCVGGAQKFPFSSNSDGLFLSVGETLGTV